MKSRHPADALKLGRSDFVYRSFSRKRQDGIVRNDELAANLVGEASQRNNRFGIENQAFACQFMPQMLDECRSWHNQADVTAARLDGVAKLAKNAMRFARARRACQHEFQLL